MPRTEGRSSGPRVTPRQFGFDAYSLVACPLQLYAASHRIGSASGFIWQEDRGYFLVTNWHVLSGRNPDSGQATHSSGAIPDRVTLGAWRQSKPTSLEAIQFDIRLLTDNGLCAWLQHSKLGQRVDVAVLPVPDEVLMPNVVALNHIPEAIDMDIDVGSEVFVLGWPLPTEVVGNMPVWKRGTIATEPLLADILTPDVLLIDTATRDGMSGAAVIARRKDGYTTAEGGMILSAGSFSRFIGIYSGRYGANDLGQVQLGRVWSRRLIPEICADGARGSFELKP